MERVCCKDCCHFRQHYVLNESMASAINCGHCVVARCKRRKPDSVACEKFQPGAPDLPDRQAVLHFLTTSFLEYVLSLSLPPEVEGQ